MLLWNMAVFNEGVATSIADADAIPVLVSLLSSAPAAVKRCAAGALSALAHGCEAHRLAIVEAGAIKPLVVLRLNVSVGAALQADDCLACLSVGNMKRCVRIQAEKEKVLALQGGS